MPDFDSFRSVQFDSLSKRALNNTIILPLIWGIDGTDAGLIVKYGTIFVADRAWELLAVSENHGTAASAGTLTIEKCAAGVAPDNGTTLIGNLSLTSTANTPVHATLTKTKGDLLIKRGERLVARDSGITGTPSDVKLTIYLKQR